MHPTATQSATALSSGEAEYVGNVKSGSFGIGTHRMARDFGDERVVPTTTDKGITSRLELGKFRHLDTGLLWLLQLLKTPENEKPADVGTKDVAEKDMKRIMTKIGFQGRRIIFVKFSFYDEDHGTIF